MRIIDGDNVLFRMIEADTSGYALRNLIYETENTSGPQIWVWDGAGGKKTRQAKYPAYKAKRLPRPENVTAAKKLFQSALLHTKAVQVQVRGWEGDDVVATLVRRYQDTTDQILIVSNDKDLLQLERPGVKCDRLPVGGVPAADIRLWKTLTGDASDCITGIPGFGPKAWLACNKEAFRELLENPCYVELWTRTVGEIQDHFQTTRAPATWLQNNEPVLRAMYEIIGLYDVPWSDMTANMIGGKSDTAAAIAIFEEFLQ